MTSPAWLNDLFAAVMVVVAVYSTGRLVAARMWSRPTHVDVDAAHVLMGAAMAGMLVPAIDPIPNGVWEVGFSLLVVWFVWRCYQFVTEHGVEGRDDDHVHHLSHYVTHLVMAGAMLYMYLAAVTPPTGSGGGMAMGTARGTTADLVLLPLAFIVVLFASGIWELDGIGRFAPGGPGRPRPELAYAAGSAAAAGGTAPAPGGPGVPSVPSVAGSDLSDQEDQHRESGQVAPWLAPRLESSCHIAMCVTMGFMLILML
ncbi:MAG: DUF5134 domain-containing protein [Acidimicrobiales bacterium]